VGERLITAKSDPVFGAVYKLCAVEKDGVFEPRIKISENIEKITNPGLKKVYRIYDENGKAVADLIARYDEVVDLNKPFSYVDPLSPWRERTFVNCHAVALQVPVIVKGKPKPLPTLAEIKEYVARQLDGEIWSEEQRFENPHVHYIDMTPSYYALKTELLQRMQK
jgi:nicotinate phosphoribosyltransferase